METLPFIATRVHSFHKNFGTLHLPQVGKRSEVEGAKKIITRIKPHPLIIIFITTPARMRKGKVLVVGTKLARSRDVDLGI